jgi:hypothetical protein
MRPMDGLALRRLAALLCGGAVAAAVAARAAPLEPSLEVRAIENPMAGGASVHLVEVRVRGGETLDRVTAEAASEGVRVLDPASVAPVPPERGLRFTVMADAAAPEPRRIRLLQEGRVARSYDVVLSGAAR